MSGRAVHWGVNKRVRARVGDCDAIVVGGLAFPQNIPQRRRNGFLY